MKNRKSRVILSIILGVVIVVITAYTHHLTNSFTIASEMVHTLGDVVTLLVYLVAISYNDKDRPSIGNVAGWSLLLAGGVACVYTGSEALYFFIGDMDFVTEPKTLSMMSLWTLGLVSFQLMLTQDLHKVLHGHDHAHVHHAHKAMRSELFADLFHSLLAVVVGSLAVLLERLPEMVKVIDLSVSLILGGWLFLRGKEILTPTKVKECHGEHYEHHHR